MCVVGVCLVRFLICSWPCMFLMVCMYGDELCVCGVFMYFIRCVMLCQWCVVSVLLDDT